MAPKEIDWLGQDYIGTTAGHLNHFSYSKHAESYHRNCDLAVDILACQAQAGFTRKTFINILKEANAGNQEKIIHGVFDMPAARDSV